MTFQHRHASGRRGSVLIYFTLALPLMILPLAGLAIEGSVGRIVQAKLQAAVDGASLGAGRLLGSSANVQEIAGEFLQANFPTGGAGFFRATNLTYTAVYTPGVVKTVAVTASVQVPATLGRLLGARNYTVSAAATATRKDTRVIMVIDRSGSMSALMPTLLNYAKGFAQKFSGSGTVGGSDELGLVAYDGSAVVGYPTADPWDPTTTATSTGGPDSLFEDGTSDDMIHQIGAITANSGTGMAEALSIAYIELQKAHMRDLAAPGSGGVDQRLNAVVLFTDGVPSAVSVYLNNPADNAIKSTSGCTYKAPVAPVPAARQIKGWVAEPGPSFVNQKMVGLYLLASSDPTASHTPAWWMANGGADAATPNPTTPETGCSGLSGTNISNSSYSDLGRIPSTDMWGNSMNTSGYTQSHVVSGPVTSIYNGTALNQTQAVDGYNWGLAIWNSVDNAADRLRNDRNIANRAGDTQSMPVTVHVIAYTGGTSGVDDGLLKRVANTSDSTSFSTAEPQGLYVPASDSTALANAFNQVASSLLHLSR
jgi:Flp pilus assembly protein TadG